MNIRVGLGTDIHRLEKGRPCILGGIELPHPKGPRGHSDGDAVLHALTDAVTGAAGLDDIGTLFPDDDPKWKGANSRDLLREAVALAAAKGWHVVNADIVIATEGPKIKPHRAAMRASIAELLGVDSDAVNVKGKTLEGLTELSEGRAVSVHAVCLLQRVD
jgi:2-C-methyl-D-erythritol 2,4-cyclodiphosphate synthase